MNYPESSDRLDNLKVGIEDFYSCLDVGLDSLRRQVPPSGFLTLEFLLQVMNLLENLDVGVRTLVEKLADLRDSSATGIGEAVEEHRKTSGEIRDACNVLKFSLTMIDEYLSSPVQVAITALERLVGLPSMLPHSFHVDRAREALSCIDACHEEMSRMQSRLRERAESRSRGLLPLNLTNAECNFPDWVGLRGALFATKTASSYLCQLLLATIACAGDGPRSMTSADSPPSETAWQTSLRNLHARVQNRNMNGNLSCFMTWDIDRLKTMLRGSRDHLDLIEHHGYLRKWKQHRDNLKSKLPRLKDHVKQTSERLSHLTERLDSLLSTVT